MCRSLVWAPRRLIQCLERRAILTIRRRLVAVALAAGRWRWLAGWFRWRMAATWVGRCGIRRIFAMWWVFGLRLGACRMFRRGWEGPRFRFPGRWRGMLRTARAFLAC